MENKKGMKKIQKGMFYFYYNKNNTPNSPIFSHNITPIRVDYNTIKRRQRNKIQKHFKDIINKLL